MKIALFGATGRFGQAIASLIKQQPDLELKEAIAHENSPHLGVDLGTILKQEYFHLPVTPFFQNRSELIIDVSLPKTFNSLTAAKEANHPLVLGMTGLSSDQLQTIEKASLDIPIFYSPNFSLSMALFQHLSILAAQKLPQATIDLIETHHTRKKDAPSGSAALLQKELKKIGKSASVHSIRRGDVIGEHRILFETDDETLEMTHSAKSRDCFAKGALAAARFLKKQKPGLYSMTDLILYSFA